MFVEVTDTMRLPLEITFRHVPKSEKLENYIRQLAAELDHYHGGIMRCRVAVEKPHKQQDAGSPCRCRIELTIPPRHELVIDEESTPEALAEGDVENDPYLVVHEAFATARRQLDRLAELQRGEVKTHPAQEVRGYVYQLRGDFGFIRTIDNRKVYFHRNSVLNGDFDSLYEGQPVTFHEEMGDNGPQASTVHVLSDPLVRPRPRV